MARSKQITDAFRSTTFVVSSIDTHRDAAARAFAEEFAPSDPQEKEKAFAAMQLVQHLVAQRMTQTMQTALDKDDAVTAEVGDDPIVREELEEARTEAYVALVEVKEAADLTTRAFVAQLGLEGPTPQDVPSLIRRGRFTADALAKAAPAPTRLMGFTFEPGRYVDGLRRSIDQLEAANKASVDDLRENQAARAARDEAAAVNARVFSRGASFVSWALRLVGMDALADRLRPSGRNPATIAEIADEPAGANAPAA